MSLENGRRHLTARIAKGLLGGDPGRAGAARRGEEWRLAAALADLLSRRGAAWGVLELRLSPALLASLEERGLAVTWIDPRGAGWLALTQKSADLGRRIPSSDGGLLDSQVSRSVAIGREKPEGIGEYARELARRGDGLFARARWAS